MTYISIIDLSIKPILLIIPGLHYENYHKRDNQDEHFFLLIQSVERRVFIHNKSGSLLVFCLFQRFSLPIC